MPVSKKLRITVWTLWMVSIPFLPLSVRTAAADGESAELADRAKAILTERCYKCHGQNGVARKNIFVLDRERLIASKALEPAT